MITEHEIETTWPISKLLINSLSSYKLLLYKLPKYDLYLQALRPIPVVYEEKPRGPKILFMETKLPHIASVRTLDEGNVVRFIQSERQFQASKIFKHGLYFTKLVPDVVVGFACNTVMNMMGLKPGATFRITSGNRWLRDFFFERAVALNEDNDFGCRFDYDEYDYTLMIRPYKRFKDDEFASWCLVTILYGKYMPNYWNTKPLNIPEEIVK